MSPEVTDPPAKAGGFSIALGEGAELEAGLGVRLLPGNGSVGCNHVSAASVATRNTGASSVA
jgi:hypothetical protein